VSHRAAVRAAFTEGRRGARSGPSIASSGTSIGANLEEAAAGQTKPDFIAKVCIARKEARETVAPEDVLSELDEAKQLVAILGSIVFNARSSSKRG
jgi:four helix bundle protein